MNHIRKLTIENFQSHENTTLEFVHGLNVIIGPSDQGKSAVLRALKWVLYNEPRGMEFIRHGTSAARVTLEMDSGYTIIRERSKSKNKYSVIQPDGTALHLEGFGNEVPEEVVKAHGIPKVMLDADIKTSLNISDQLEAPLLLAETGSMKAKAIGRLMGVHILDQAIRNCLTDLKRENQASERTQQELSEVSEKLLDFEGLEDLRKRLEMAEQTLEQLELLQRKYGSLEELKKGMEAWTREYNDIGYKLSKLVHIDACEQTVKQGEWMLAKLKTLERLKMKNRELDSEMEKSRRAIDGGVHLDDCGVFVQQAEAMEAKRKKLLSVSEKYYILMKEIGKTEKALNHSGKTEACSETLGVLQQKRERLDQLKERKQSLDTVTKGLSEGNAYLAQCRKNIRGLTEEYAKTLRKMGRCPICSSQISDMTIEEILKHASTEVSQQE